jgi:hypothetical protein
LNGFHLDKQDLCSVSYCLIKGGMNLKSRLVTFVDWFDDKSYDFTNFWYDWEPNHKDRKAGDGQLGLGYR